MRYNERELLSLSRQPAEKAAEILMRVPKKGSGEGEGAEGGAGGLGWDWECWTGCALMGLGALGWD